MASSVTIDPTLGNPVVAFQGGVYDIDGGGVGGDAIDLRRMVEACSAGQEGVLDATGWKVTATNGDLTVDVAANVGLAVVQGDDVTAQGRYAVAPHNAEITLDLTAADGSAPRLDQIVLHVRDDAHDGSGSNDARVYVLDGTPTGGATLDNRTGAASLPDTCLLLADVLVAASATEVDSTDVRDRRRWARGAYHRIVRTSGNYTNSSSTPAEIDATNLKPRIECTGKPVRVSLRGQATHSVDQATVQFQIWQDGAQAEDTEFNARWTAPGFHSGVLAEWDLLPAAGSHQFSVAWATSNATATLYASDPALQLVVEEIVRTSASNG